MVIGAFPGWSSGRAEVELGAGDTLLLYSDGVTEAADPDRGSMATSDWLRCCATPGEWTSGSCWRW